MHDYHTIKNTKEENVPESEKALKVVLCPVRQIRVSAAITVAIVHLTRRLPRRFFSFHHCCLWLAITPRMYMQLHLRNYDVIRNADDFSGYFYFQSHSRSLSMVSLSTHTCTIPTTYTINTYCIYYTLCTY